MCTLGRNFARRGFDVHVLVGVVCTVFRQYVWTDPLSVYLVRVIGARVWYKLHAISTRGHWVRVLCGVGL